MSPVDICNQALAHIGDRRISNIDEAAQLSDPLAYYCSQFYVLSKNQVLAAQRWTFAKKAAALSRRTGVISLGFTYVHALPVDCIRVMNLVRGSIPSGETEPTYGSTRIDKFKIVGRDVWSNYEHVALYYVCKAEDPTFWTPHFAAAVSRLLAHYLAGAVANDPRLAREHLDIYERVALPNAQFYDAVQDESGENHVDSRETSPTLLARRDASGGINEPDI
tara:strand:+ start:1374 stop:2036 length:663 start_codon:yes stop_codon:yes gene_type:complete